MRAAPSHLRAVESLRPLIQRGCLPCGSCSSGRRFVSGFLQIPPRDLTGVVLVGALQTEERIEDQQLAAQVSDGETQELQLLPAVRPPVLSPPSSLLGERITLL